MNIQENENNSIVEKNNILDENGNIKDEILEKMIKNIIERNPLIYERLAQI